MAEANVIATIRQKSFPLEITNISKLETVWSPEEMVHGIPWKITVKKKTRQEENWLSVHLHCAITDKSPDWSHVATATFKLQPLSGNKSGITCDMKPNVFDSSGLGYGYSSFIEWNELLNTANNYVKDDTLTLDIHIEAADPKNPSKLLFQTTEKSCVESCSSKYRLNVTNIDNLMAVQSPQFKMRNLSWVLMVYKHLSHLGVSLHCRSPSTEISCKLEVLLKLISSKKDVKPIEQAPQTAVLKNGGVLTVGKIISWDELVKPENGFVNDNSIVMEVEVRASKPKGITPNNQDEAKRLKLECAICFEVFSKQEVSSTQCGHLFCSPCIRHSIEAREKCPSCNADVTLRSLIRVYLPINN